MGRPTPGCGGRLRLPTSPCDWMHIRPVGAGAGGAAGCAAGQGDPRSAVRSSALRRVALHETECGVEATGEHHESTNRRIGHKPALDPGDHRLIDARSTLERGLAQPTQPPGREQFAAESDHIRVGLGSAAPGSPVGIRRCHPGHESRRPCTGTYSQLHGFSPGPDLCNQWHGDRHRLSVGGAQTALRERARHLGGERAPARRARRPCGPRF